MLKQTVEYTDFDDNKAVETLYFNLTKSELTENLHLKDELEDIQKMIVGEQRSLESTEITKILDLVKTFMRLSYGIRSADGKRFIKTPEQWTEFTQTATYDAFLFSLFEHPDRAIAFMSGILPMDLREKARAAAELELAAAGISERPEAKVVTTEPATPAVRNATPEELAAARALLAENLDS